MAVAAVMAVLVIVVVVLVEALASAAVPFSASFTLFSSAGVVLPAFSSFAASFAAASLSFVTYHACVDFFGCSFDEVSSEFAAAATTREAGARSAKSAIFESLFEELEAGSGLGSEENADAVRGEEAATD